ncbi:MAG: hypothetical protein KAZ20_02280 [Sediminibacterium sp.]|nr:hypothetical protein [Sediminibacterium sp.]
MKFNWTVLLTTLLIGVFASKNGIAQQKPLSIQFIAPTQMYQGESIKLKVQIKHQITKEQTGHLQLALFNAETKQSVDGWFLNFFPFQYFTTLANENFETEFPFTVPNDYVGKFELELVAEVNTIKDSIRITIPTLIKR